MFLSFFFLFFFFHKIREQEEQVLREWGVDTSGRGKIAGKEG
jgi:hypothetical protein